VKKYVYLGLILSLPTACAAADSPRAIYAITTVAGSASLGDAGPAIDAQIGAIQGVASDLAGNVYLSDTTHNCVRKIDSKGIITTVAGTGVAGFSGDGGPATAAQLNRPYGLAVDVNGYLYIADLNNNRVRRVSPAGMIETYAGSNGDGSSGDGGPATSAQMLSPRNVTIDSAGNLYISEFAAHRIRKVTPNGTITTAAGTGIAGFRGDGGPATAGQLASPAGLALDGAGNLYIADSQNQRIREVLSNSNVMITVLGGSTAITLLTPFAVAVDATGDLLVADTIPTVHEFTVAGKWIAVAGTSTGGFSGDGGPATAAQLTEPLDLSIGSNGNLYIADLHRLREVDTKNIISTLAGADYLYGIGDGGVATAAELYLPSTVTLDAVGNLYIADTGTNRVRQVSSSGTIATFAGTGMAAPGGEATPAVSTSLMTPTAAALDPSGNLFIVETGANRIRAVTADGLITTIAGTGVAGLGPDSLPATQTQLRAPQGVCLDRSGNLYIVDTGNSRILMAPPLSLVTTIAGNGGAGAAGDGGLAPFAQLNQPTACAADSAGNLYIADTYNHSIRKVDPTGTITTVAGTGIAGNGGDEGPATSASLNAPRGIAVDDNGDLYISDTGNNAIRLVTPDGLIHTIAGTGTAGFSGDGGAALSAAVNTPGGIQLDGSGDLYFADTNNNRVRQLMPTGAIAPLVVTPPTPLSVMNVASLSTGSVAPGEVVSIFGAGMGPQTGVTAVVGPNQPLATQLAGVQVLFDGVAAPLFYTQASQINAQVPYGVAGNASTNIQVIYQDGPVNSTTVAVASAAPGVFPSAINQDGSYNSSSNPAFSGSYLTIYATGGGLTTGANIAGQAAAAPYPPPQLAVAVTIGGVPAQIMWTGSAPGLVGLLQVNLIVPGPYLPSGAAPLELTVGSAAAPLMTVWVQ
jgi:uncharacterized protein (TIGR03437 family)